MIVKKSMRLMNGDAKALGLLPRSVKPVSHSVKAISDKDALGIVEVDPEFLMKVCLRVVWAVFLCACPWIIGCSAQDSGSSEADSAAASGPPPALVQVEPARRDTIRPYVLAVGTVRARHTSIVASASDGVVASFPVEHGQYVTQGQELSRLRMESTDTDLMREEALLAEREAEYQAALSPRKEDVEEAAARLQAAEIAMENARRRLDELKSLGQRGAANASAIRDTEDNFDQQNQLLLAANAVFKRVAAGVREEEKLQAKARRDAQQKLVEFLYKERDKRITMAPLSGFVVEEHTYVGEWLSKGTPVVTIADLSSVDVEVQIDQAFVSQVKLNDPVEVRVAGAINPQTQTEVWSGVVHAILLRSDWEAGSRSFPVIVRIRNFPNDADMPFVDEKGAVTLPVLRDGMMAEVQFGGQPVDALLVPKDSLVRSNRGIFVFAIDPAQDGSQPAARQIAVEPGISDEGWIEVKCQGLEPGTPVVTVGGERLRPFQSVVIQQLETSQDAGVAGQAQTSEEAESTTGGSR